MFTKKKASQIHPILIEQTHWNRWSRQACIFTSTITKDLIVKTELTFKHFKSNFAYWDIVSLILILVFLVFHQVTLSIFQWYLILNGFIVYVICVRKHSDINYIFLIWGLTHIYEIKKSTNLKFFLQTWKQNLSFSP